MVKTFCIYAASSNKVANVYLEAAAGLGKTLAENKIRCMYGGGHAGLMGALADAMMQNGGEITGVIPQFMVEQSWHHTGLNNLVVTQTMHERKAYMAAIADAAIALPGGVGTLDELMEIITWKQLCIFSKPVIIVNINGYFDPLIQMFEKAIAENFMRVEHGSIWQVVNRIEDVLPAIENSSDWNKDITKFAVV